MTDRALLQESVSILGDLIAFETISPDSNLAMIAYLAERLEAVGARVEVFEDPSGKKAEQIINEVLGAAKYKARPTPAPSTKILHRDLDGTPFKGDFDYRSVVGKLNFLEKGSRP